MPVLTQGNTANITIGANDSITLQNRAGQSASLTVAGTLVNGQHSGTRTYGPYANGGAVVLTATAGDVYYEVGDGAYAGVSNAVVQVDTSGRPIRTVTADGQAVGGGVTAQANTVVLLGDSMTAQNNRQWFGTSRITSLTRTGGVATLVLNVAHNLWNGRRIRIRGESVAGFDGVHTVTVVDNNTVTFPNPGPDAAGARNSTVVLDLGRRAGNGYFLWLQIALGGRLNLLSNEGINAQTTAQILARVPDVTALAPAHCIVLGGYNDLGKGLTPAQTLSNLTQIAQQLSAAGIMCHMCTFLPIGASASTFTPTNVAYIAEVNRGLRTLAASNTVQGLVLHDTHDAFVDRNNTAQPGVARAGVLSNDDIHPSGNGAKVMGDLLAAGMRQYVPALNRLPSSYADVTVSGTGGFNVIKAGPYVASGGTTSSPVTGTTALDLRTQRGSGSTGTCVASVVTAADGSLRQRLVISPGGVESWTIMSNDSASVIPLLTAGERRRFVAAVRVSGATAGGPLNYINARVRFTVGGVTLDHAMTIDASTFNINTDIDGVLVSEPCEIPAGTITNFEWRFDVHCTGAGSDLTVEIGRVGYLLES